MSELRNRLVINCPEEFKPELKGIIDEIENRIGAVLKKMEIRSLSDLSKIEEAYQDLYELHLELY